MTAESNAAVDAAQAAGATGASQEYTYGSSRVHDVDKDTGADERYEEMGADRADAWGWNGKRTYDLHQTLDTDSILYNRKHQAKLDSMEVRHAEEEHKQKMRQNDEEFRQKQRHYEDMHTMRFNSGTGFWADTVQEAFADRVAEKVCARIGK